MRYFPGPEALHKPICLPIVFPMKRSRPAEDARKQRTVAKDNTSINAAGKGVEDNRVESRKDQGDEHAYAPVEARALTKRPLRKGAREFCERAPKESNTDYAYAGFKTGENARRVGSGQQVRWLGHGGWRGEERRAVVAGSGSLSMADELQSVGA
ncbi:hypothetical protein MMC21_006617 [Puttea exsequens]|nr:hypothetical protein [Puttea exsequens]